MKKLRLFPIVICVALTLSGCGVSSSDREKLYNAIIETGDLQLSADIDEYENKLEGSSGPVPGGITYYTYVGDNGEKYRFNYQKIGYKEPYYRVVVHTEYLGVSNPEKIVDYEYTYNKSAFFRKMRLIDSCICGYELKYNENEGITKSGIRKFSIYTSEVRLYFDQNDASESIAKYIDDYNAGVIKNIDIVVKTNMGEYKAEKIIVAKKDEKKGLTLCADISVEGMPESVFVGDVKINF